MSMMSKIMAMIGDPLKGLIKKLGGGAPIEAPGGFKPPTVQGKLTPMQRSYFAKRAAAARTPEQRAAIAQKASESRTPESRSASAKQAAANRTPEERAAIAKKAAETRAENQREAARYAKSSNKRAKSEAKAKAKIEEKYGSEENSNSDSKTSDEDREAQLEERRKKIHDVIVPESAREKVFYNKARRDLIMAFEEEGITWVEDQRVIEAEARNQRETQYAERNGLIWKEIDELNESNPDLSNPSNYRR